MKAQFVNENIRFERSKDPKRSLGLGPKSPEFIKSIDWGIVHNSNLDRIFDESRHRNHEVIFYNDIPVLVYEQPKDLAGYSHERPWIAFPTQLGPDRMAHAEPIARSTTREGAIRNIKKQIRYYLSKNESVNFERGKDPKESMGIGRKISLELPTYVEPGYFQGDLSFEQVDDDTQYFIRALDEAGVDWEFMGFADPYVDLRITGYKEDIIKVLPMWDANGRDEYELADVLEDWEGDQETIEEELY